MSGNKTSQRLISKLRTRGLLPDGPAELIRTPRNRGKSRLQWQWHARNPVTKENYEIGSPYRMEDLLTARTLEVEHTSEGRTIVIPGASIQARSSRQDQLRSYPCSCGARVGEHCIVNGKRSEKTIHADRLRKYHRDHG